MAILKELWSGECESAKVKTSYQYVLELKERLEETVKLAQEALEKCQEKDKKYYNRNAKRKNLENGTEVLVMLPTDSNKLLMQWRGPYKVIAKVGENDYRVMVGKKIKTFHANMLQLYCRKEEKEGHEADAEKPQDVHVVCVAECDIEESSIDEET